MQIFQCFCETPTIIFFRFERLWGLFLLNWSWVPTKQYHTDFTHAVIFDRLTPRRQELLSCAVRMKHVKMITGTNVRWTRHTGHLLISDVLLWTPTHGHASVGRPAKSYLHQLRENTRWNLLGAINDEDRRGEEKRGRARKICAVNTNWWWLPEENK